MNFKLFSALALLSIVAAQSDSMSDTMTDSAAMPMPSGGAGPAIPSCLETCIGQSGCTITDVDCLCNKSVDTITSCVTSTCSQEDQQTAASLQSSLCPDSGSMSGGMNSTMVTGSATTMGANSTSAIMTSSSVSSATRTTPSVTMTPRPITSNTPSTSSTSAGSASSTNAAVSQNMVTQGVWVMLASLIGVAVAA